MATIERCTICNTDLYRVERGIDNTWTAYDQHTGEVVPIPPTVLKNYERGPQQTPTTFACKNGYPTSYRCAILPNGSRASRIGDRHIQDDFLPSPDRK